MSRILVAGELNVDLVMSGLPALPVLGQELIGTGFNIVMGSSSAITAARLAALGAHVDFVGQIGSDDLGHFMLRELQTFGVGTQLIETIPNTNTDVTISLTYEHDRALMTFPGLMTTFAGQSITPDLLANYTHVHVGSFFLQTGLQAQLPALFSRAHDLGLTTSLDTGWDPHQHWMQNPHLGPTLAETDYFFPNEKEALALSDGTTALADRVGGTLIVKRGGDGASAIPANSKHEQIDIAALPVEVVDTTGAGDAFNAGFLYATIINRAALPDALRFAVACGAQAVTQVGGATNAPTAEAISTHYLKRSTI
ncbi:MAG: carbohydrate kinase family protein [Anaerolineae bacterium]|nr:carbohydrate kinase family protein [Anaerolineae bacterium]